MPAITSLSPSIPIYSTLCLMPVSTRVSTHSSCSRPTTRYIMPPYLPHFGLLYCLHYQFVHFAYIYATPLCSSWCMSRFGPHCCLQFVPRGTHTFAYPAHILFCPSPTHLQPAHAFPHPTLHLPLTAYSYRALLFVPHPPRRHAFTCNHSCVAYPTTYLHKRRLPCASFSPPTLRYLQQPDPHYPVPFY